MMIYLGNYFLPFFYEGARESIEGPHGLSYLIRLESNMFILLFYQYIFNVKNLHIPCNVWNIVLFLCSLFFFFLNKNIHRYFFLCFCTEMNNLIISLSIVRHMNYMWSYYIISSRKNKFM